MAGNPLKAWPNPDQYLLLTYNPTKSAELELVDFPTCKQIATDWVQAYADKYTSKSVDLMDAAKLVCDEARRQYLVSKLDLMDYWRGVAQAINPYPLNSPTTFYESDAEALEADWLTVRTDIEKSWNTARCVHHALRHSFHERQPQSGGKDEPGSGADEFARHSETARGYSSRS
jgi:hypothetical protein